MKLFTKHTIFGIIACLVTACQHDDITTKIGNKLSDQTATEFTITGDFVPPQVVDLDSSSEHRALVLRPNDHNYPKIVLTDFENGNNSFKPFFSSVFLFEAGSTVNRQLYVEDNEREGAEEGSFSLGNSASSSRIPNAQRGVSRLVRHGNGYQFIVRFSAPNRRSGDSWLDTYPNGKTYRMSVAISPNTNGGASFPSPSVHRIYAPILTNTETYRNATNPNIPQLPPLKLTTGDYVLANSSPSIEFSSQSKPGSDNMLKIPIISDYLINSKVDKPTHASLKTTFRIRGVLLSLKLANRTGRDIVVKRLRTRSNHIAYSGFYEMWLHNGGQNGEVPEKTPAFARAAAHTHILRDAIYTFNLQNTDGAPNFTIPANNEAPGRLYLWGGLDRQQAGSPSTKCQIVYEYTDEPGVEYFSETISLDAKTANRKFQEGTVYLITVPISKPHYTGRFAYNDFDRRTDDWQ